MRKYICLVVLIIFLLLTGCNQTKKDVTTMDDNEIDKETQKTLNSGEIFVYSDEQLIEIAELADTKSTLMEQYPTTYIQAISIVQNDISNSKPAVEVHYRGETKVLRLMFDGSSGSKISSHFYSTFCSKNELEILAIGQSLSDVRAIDPNGEYLFLYTGRNDTPKISTHYTTDGFVVSITYDQNNGIENINIRPL